MLERIRKQFGLVCGGPRDKSGTKKKGPMLGEVEPRDKSVGLDGEPKRPMTDRERMFKMLYGDMESDLAQETKGRGGEHQDKGALALESRDDDGGGDSDRVVTGGRPIVGAVSEPTGLLTGIAFGGGGGGGGGGAALEGASGPNDEDVRLAWTETVDPASGECFFLNTITGERKAVPTTTRMTLTTDGADETVAIVPRFAPVGIRGAPTHTPEPAGTPPAGTPPSDAAEEGGYGKATAAPNADFFAAFANKVSGGGGSIKHLLTEQRVQEAESIHASREQNSALESLFAEKAPPTPAEQPVGSLAGQPLLGPKLPSIFDDADFLAAAGAAESKGGRIIVPPTAATQSSPYTRTATPGAGSPLRIGGGAGALNEPPPILLDTTQPLEARSESLYKPSVAHGASALDEKRPTTSVEAQRPAPAGYDTDDDKSTVLQAPSYAEPLEPLGPDACEDEDDLVASILKGIKASIGYYFQRMKRVEGGVYALEENDFKAELKLQFTTETGHAGLGAFGFKSYAGPVFENLRKMAGVSTEDFLRSLSGLAAQAEFVPKKGGWFYFTHDTCMLVKTQTRAQVKTFRGVLRAYYEHVRRNPRTLIEPVLGVYRLDHKGRATYITVVKNVLYTQLPIHNRYQLKGVRSGRKASKKERELFLGMLREDDFGEQRLLLGSKKSAFLAQLSKDTRFLASQKLISYKLLLGVHEAKHHTRDDSDADAPGGDAGDSSIFDVDTRIDSLGADGKQAQEVYFVGLTGMFQAYNGKKKAQRFLKGLVTKKDNMSVVDHEYYQKRLLQYMDEHIQ